MDRLKAFMNKRRAMMALAVVGAMGAGVAAGFVFGSPLVSSADTSPSANSPATKVGARPGPGGPFGLAGGPLGGKGGPFGPTVTDTAGALGISTSDLKTDLGNGQSIADIASSKGIATSTVISTLVTDVSNRIDAAVTAGHLSSATAAKLKSNLTQRITDFVDGKPGRPGRFFGGPWTVTGTAVPDPLGFGVSGTMRPGPRGFGFKQGGGPFGPTVTDTAGALGISTSDLKTDLGKRQSIADIASSKGIATSTVISTLVTDVSNRIDAAVTAGQLTSDMASLLKANLTARITAYVDGKAGRLGPGPGPFLKLPPGVTGTAIPGPGFRGPGPGGPKGWFGPGGPDGWEPPTGTATPAP